MPKVVINFIYDGSDSDNPTGLSEDEFDKLHDGISSLGGYDISFEKEEDEDAAKA
jgi:hypothetical protein